MWGDKAHGTNRPPAPIKPILAARSVFPSGSSPCGKLSVGEEGQGLADRVKPRQLCLDHSLAAWLPPALVKPVLVGRANEGVWSIPRRSAPGNLLEGRLEATGRRRREAVVHSVARGSLKASLATWLDEARPKSALVGLLLLLLLLSVPSLPLLSLLGVLLLLCHCHHRYRCKRCCCC